MNMFVMYIIVQKPHTLMRDTYPDICDRPGEKFYFPNSLSHIKLE